MISFIITCNIPQAFAIMKRSEKRSERKIERKTIEKDRRIRMKSLCFKLVSLIPDHHFNATKEVLSHQEQLEEAARYIKILRERIEALERRKRAAVGMNAAAANMSEGEAQLPTVTINELGSDLEVVLISGLRKTFMLHQIITILEDGGAQVVGVNIATVGHQIFHTLHAQVKLSRVGVDTSRITEKIHELIF